MKDFKFKTGYKVGTEKRFVPGVGLMLIDNNISDKDAKALIAAGVTDIVEPIKAQVIVTPKKPIANAKEARKPAVSAGADDAGVKK